VTGREAAQRLADRLDPSDLELLTSPELFRRYSFNARERHCLFINANGQRFLEAGYPLGVDVDLEGRGVAVGDLDTDGKLDLVVRNVARKKIVYFHNELPARAHFVRVKLTGTRSNRDAVGALVRLSAGGTTQTRVRLAGNGFQGQSEPVLHFGLGSAARVESLSIRWPSGDRQRFTDLPIDCELRIVEGEDHVDAIELPSVRKNGSTNPGHRRNGERQ
jgi:hypothetical protein